MNKIIPDFQAIASVRKKNEDYRSLAGDNRKALVITFGCQMNEHDSEKYMGLFKSMGFDIVSDYSLTEVSQIPDVILINTCCVRENAEDKVFGHLGALKGAKRLKPELITIVAGCMTEQKHICDKIQKTYKNVDLILGTDNMDEFPRLLLAMLDSHKTICASGVTNGKVVEDVPIMRQDNSKAWVTIMYGCNNFCTYCIVPYVRGRERSRHPDDILREVQTLSDEGYTEITLLGQNVNSYGKDLEDACDFADLLRRICNETDIPRIRFMTSHPKDISEKLIQTMASEPKICRQLHLPVQSGSSRILRKMNRHYSKEEYLSKVETVRKYMPDVTLTTDIIVGFPGETEEDFEETLSLIEKVRYDSAFTFIYSKREGTPAARDENQIDDKTVHARFDRLLALQNRISKEINDSLVGRDLDVLVEGESKTNPDRLMGRTEGNKVVNFTFNSDKKLYNNKVVRVHIDSVQTWSLDGHEI